jgi:hypothetical protein
MLVMAAVMLVLCEMQASRSSEYEGCCLLGCDMCTLLEGMAILGELASSIYKVEE